MKLEYGDFVNRLLGCGNVVGLFSCGLKEGRGRSTYVEDDVRRPTD
jgi:hypothetical protein